MSPPSSRQPAGRTIPMWGLLSLMTGGAILLVLWKFSRISNRLSDNSRTLVILVAGILIAWGVGRIITALRSPGGSRRGLHLSRHRVMLPRHGLVYLGIMAALFVGSLLGRSNSLMLVFAMMAGPFILNGWVTYSMLKRLHVNRRVQTATHAGDRVSVEITLKNNKWLLASWLMAVQDSLAGANEQLSGGVLYSRVPPRGERRACYDVRLMQRGRYHFGPVYVSTRFPLGLVERGLVLDSRDEILVYPRLGRLSATWRQTHLLADESFRTREASPGPFDDVFHGIREFRWGDNPRAIHWRTSARQNSVMVREFRQSRERGLVVLLDLYQPKRPTDSDRERVELAVSLAATICVEQVRYARDATLNVLIAGQSVTRWKRDSRATGLASLLDSLAVAEADPSADVALAIEEASAERTPGTQVVLITTRQSGDTRDEGPQSLIGDETVRADAGINRVIHADRQELAPFFQLA